MIALLGNENTSSEVYEVKWSFGRYDIALSGIDEDDPVGAVTHEDVTQERMLRKRESRGEEMF